jgi:hypothetical protein
LPYLIADKLSAITLSPLMPNASSLHSIPVSTRSA